MKRPWRALENIFLASSKMLKTHCVLRRRANLTCDLRVKIDVGLLGACRGAGRTVWRQFRNSEQLCYAA